jgi:HlyD family secretion protein
MEVAIEIGRSPEALVLPTGALIRDGSDWAVYRIAGGKATKTRAEITATSGGWAKLAGSGALSAGDRVILYPGDLVKDGVCVRERENHAP